MISYIINGTQSGMRRMTSCETVINRLRASHILLTHGCLMEGLLVPLEFELCHNQTMTVKDLSTGSANLAILRLRFFDGSIPNTLKQILERNKVNPDTIEFLKESNIYNRA